MKKIEVKNYTVHKKLLCGWTDKRKYLIHYRMLKTYVRLVMVINNVHEVESFKQSKWLEKFTIFNIQKRIKAKNDFEKDFQKLLNSGAFGKFLKNVRQLLIMDFI